MFDAIRTGNVEALNQALGSGANIHERDDEGRTALHIATFMDHRNLEVFNAVLAAEPGLDVKDNRGHTALHLAAGGGLTEKGLALIDAGADIHATTPSGATIHDYASAASDNLLMRAIESRQAENLRQRLEANTAPAPARYATDDWAPTPEQKTQDLGRLTQSLSQGGEEIEPPVRARSMRL